MAKNKEENKFMVMIKEGLSSIVNIISESIFSQISGGADIVMDNIDDRILKIENRITRKISSFLIIGFGLVFLIFALFFYLKEFLNWGNALAFFSIGIIIFITGLLIKLKESERR